MTTVDISPKTLESVVNKSIEGLTKVDRDIGLAVIARFLTGLLEAAGQTLNDLPQDNLDEED
ncbi:MAG: hypothetical protein ACOY16_09225 [Chloroflexota bacterium]